MALQQELRKIVQRIKGKAPTPILNELMVLAPINPHNRPFQSSSTRADQRRDFNFLSPEPNKTKTPTQTMKPIIKASNEPMKAIMINKSEINRNLVNLKKEEIYEKPKFLENNQKAYENNRPQLKVIEPIQTFDQIKIFHQLKAEPLRNLEPIIFEKLPDKILKTTYKTETELFQNVEKPQIPINENIEDQTKKSPLLPENCVENKGETEQNTIIKVKFDHYEQIPEANLSKEQDEIIDKMSLLCDNRQNFMSFKEFAEASNQKSDETRVKDENIGIFEKMQKLSFREEDYFEKSMRIEHRADDEDENCFELLNEKHNLMGNNEKLFKENQENHENYVKKEEKQMNSNENSKKVVENQNFEKNQNVQENRKIQENYKTNKKFDENRNNVEFQNFAQIIKIQKLEEIHRSQNIEKNQNNEEIQKNQENIEKYEEHGLFFPKISDSNKNHILIEQIEKKPNPLAESTNKISQSITSMRFSRPYDLKPDERDKYIDEIYLKFKFPIRNEENANFQENYEKTPQKEDLKELFLGVKFEKNVIDRLRNELALDYLTPENIIDEIFNVQNLSKISKTFFKIKMQV